MSSQFNKDKLYTKQNDASKEAVRSENTSVQLLKEPILGKHFKLPGRTPREPDNIKLNSKSSRIPIYSHLKVHETEILQRPSTPPMLKRLAEEEYMDYYTPQPAKKTINNTKDVSLSMGSSRRTSM